MKWPFLPLDSRLPMMPGLRIFLYSIGALVGFFLLVILLMALLFGTQWGRETVIDQGLRRVLSYNEFKVELEGVRAESSEHWQLEQLTLSHRKQPLIKVQSLDLLLPWMTLFDHEIRIESLSVGSIWLESDPEKWPEKDVPQAVQPTENSLPEWLNTWRVSLGRFIVNEMTVQHPSLPKALTANLEMEGFHLADIATNNPDIELLRVDLNIDKAAHWIRGSYVEETLKGNVRLNHFPLEVFEVLLDDFNQGWLSANLTLDGTILSPQLAGRIDTSTTLLDLPLKARAQINFQAMNLDFSDFEGHWDSLDAKAEGRVNLVKNTLDIQLDQATMPLSFVGNFGAQLPPELVLDVSAQNIAIKGAFTDIRYQGLIKGLGYFDQLPLRLQVDVDGGLNDIRLSRAELQSDKLQLDAEGTIHFDGPLALTGHFTGLTDRTLARFGPAISPATLKHLAFTSGGEFQVNGTFTAPLYSAGLSAEGAYKHIPLYLISQFSGSTAEVNIRKFELRQQRESVVPALAVNGKIDLARSSMQLNVDTESLPLELASMTELVLPEGLNGKLSSNSVLKGPWALPEVSANGKLSGHFKHRPYEVIADGHFTNGLIDIQNARVASNTLRANAKGSLQLDGPLNLSADFTGLTDDVFKLISPRILPEPIKDFSFSAAGELLIEGSQAQPLFSGELTLDGAYKQQPIILRSRFLSSLTELELQQFEIRRQPDGATMDGAASDSAKTKLTANGKIDLANSELDLVIEAKDAPIELVSLAGFELPKDLNGMLFLNSHLHGPWERPVIAVQGHMEGNFRNEPYLMEVDASLDKGKIDIRKSRLALSGKELLAIEGHLDAEKQNLRLTVNDFDLRQLTLLGLKQARGRVQADLHYQGNRQHSDFSGQIDYRTNWEWVNPQAQMMTSPVHFKTTINTVDQISLIHASMLFQEKETSELQVKAPLAPYREWLLALVEGEGSRAMPTQFELIGNLDLKVLQAVIQNELESFGGTTELNLSARGTRKALKLDGAFKLIDGYYKNEINGINITGIQLAALLKDQSVHSITGEAHTPDNGRLELAGEASLDEAKTIALELALKDAFLLERPEIEASLSGELALRGDHQGYLLSGDLSLQPLMLKINSAFESVPEIEVQIIEKDEDPETLSRRLKARSATYPLTIDLDIHTAQQAFLRGRGLEAELKGDVKVTGPVNQIHYTGKFQTIRGHMTLFNKRFELVKGTVSFDDANAILNIQAENIGKDITFKVTASGTLDDLKLQLTSDPMLPEDEVLARLLFGKSIKNMSPIQALRLVTALQTLQGGNSLLPDPVEYARDLVSVDELNIESVETEKGSGVTVGVGKYLSERVYLEVERTPDPNKPWQGRLDIELMPRLHLETTTSGSEGDQGVELIWKKDY